MRTVPVAAGEDLVSIFEIGQSVVMDMPQSPPETFPNRIPIKVFGRSGQLQAEQVLDLISKQLGPQPAEDRSYSQKANGPWISLTFWVTLPDEQAERLLREAIQRLPGVALQL